LQHDNVLVSFGAAILSGLFFKDLLAGSFRFFRGAQEEMEKRIYIALVALRGRASFFNPGRGNGAFAAGLPIAVHSQKSRVFEANFTKISCRFYALVFFAVSSLLLFLGVMTER